MDKKPPWSSRASCQSSPRSRKITSKFGDQSLLAPRSLEKAQGSSWHPKSAAWRLRCFAQQALSQKEARRGFNHGEGNTLSGPHRTVPVTGHTRRPVPRLDLGCPRPSPRPVWQRRSFLARPGWGEGSCVELGGDCIPLMFCIPVV